MAEGQFAAVCCHAVSQCGTDFNTVALEYYRTLVDAGGLVGTHEFNEIVGIELAIVSADNDLTTGDSFNSAASLGENADTGVLAGYPFHTGSDERSFRTEQRNCLTLHVSTHQCAVRIIMFEEWNQGCADGNDLFRGYVHQVDFVWFSFEHVSAAAAGYVLMNEMTFCIQRFTGLRDDLVFFDISGYVLAFVRNLSINDLTVRRFDQAVFIDDPVVGQRGNQTDVRAFRRFYRAHASIVGIMNVADFEPCAFTGQTARSQCGQTAFMSQFCQRVSLVHELGQLGTSEEFLDSCNNRTDVDKSLRGHLVLILGGHSFTNDSFHTGQADAELVLQQFAYAAYAAVAEMVDIIALAIALHHVQQVIDACDDVAVFQCTEVIFTVAGRADHLDRCSVILLGHDFNLAVAVEYSAFFNFCDSFIINEAVCFNDDFAGFHVDDRAFSLVAEETVSPGQLLVQLVTANLSQIIAARVKEEIVQQCSAAFFCCRFARAKLVVNFNQSGLSVRCAVFFQRLFDVDVVIE